MKTSSRTYVAIVGLLVIVLLQAGLVDARPLDVKNPRDGGDNSTGPMFMPSPLTVDQITHNKGNIVTTIDNWGYIGGYQFYDYPSGEWPRNSGHDYIGEIRYWMGAVDAFGDTLVANTYEDFQGLPSLISSVLQHRILLSTDTTRYYDYNLEDTVGLGYNNPAYGWRVWNADSSDWVYTRNYNSLDSVFYPGGPISLQESHYRFNDAALGTPLMGLEITHTVLQWNYCYNEDFMFVILDITNNSATDYNNFAFGLYVDLDVGGPDGTGENGRLGDLVAYDSVANLAWTYDEDSYDEGWKSKTGKTGTKYLETPDGIGMTGFRTGAWELLPDDDEGKFRSLDSVGFDAPLAPWDQYYIQCTRGISLEAGKTVRVVYALIAGQDSTGFRNNADLAQQLYDNFYVGPEPPVTPLLTATAGDRKAYLHWNDTSEASIDPLSGEADFSGYKLYRSDNQGITWGEPIYNTGNNCLTVDYETIASFKVNTPGDPIQHSFIDSGLYNGIEYWYCLVAIDTGASETGVDPLQSGFGIAGYAPNIVAVRPRSDPAGFYEAAGTVVHEYVGFDSPSEGEVIPIVFDRESLQGASYQVVFEDTPDQTYWHLINETIGDTVLVDQTRYEGDPGLYELAQGLRVVVRNADHVPQSMDQTEFGGSDTTLVADPASFYGPITEFFYGVTFGDQHYRSTYEFRYTGNNTAASAFNDTLGLGPAWSVPLEVWNTSTSQRVSLAVYDFGLDGAWDPWDLLIVVNYPYDSTVDPFAVAWPTYFSWMMGLDPAVFNPVDGDVLTIQGAPLNGPDDVFTFQADGVNPASAQASLGNIRVVPNPYMIHNWSKIETSANEGMLAFENLPDECTIRIYTLAGDLVETIRHDNADGTAWWDLMSVNNQQVASGIYIYHVESPYGEHLGRFAVIK